MDFLKQIRYPGRFIILGKDGENFVSIYGATGRSPSSLNRKFIQQGNEILMTQTSEGGNVELLTYPAIRFSEKNLVVANGRQIEEVKTFGEEMAGELLEKQLVKENYEPDDNKTPRITGCYFESESDDTAGLHIIRSIDGSQERLGWTVPLLSGEGLYISTYSGDDINPAPSFIGKPILVKIDFGSAENAAKSIFDLLAPSLGGRDYRVGVVACYKKFGKAPTIIIENKIF